MSYRHLILYLVNIFSRYSYAGTPQDLEAIVTDNQILLNSISGIVVSIKSKTDLLTFSGTAVVSTISPIAVDDIFNEIIDGIKAHPPNNV